MAKITEIEKIEEYLSACTIGKASDGADGTGLNTVHQRIFNHKSNITKTQAVNDLAEFYANEQNVIDIFYGLSECERDFVSYIVQYDGNEFLPATVEYAKKYNFALEYTTKWGYKKNLLDDYKYSKLKFLSLLNQRFPGTKSVVLFPSGKDMPTFVFKILKKIIEPMKFEYGEYVPQKNDYIICRENKIGDFAALVRLAGSESFKVKEDTFDLTKAKLAKIAEIPGFEEVCDNNGKFCTPKEAKRGNDFKVAQSVFVLAANSGLLDIDGGGNVSPGKNSLEMLSLPRHELAKRLFEDYMKENRIYELHYIMYVTTYDGDASIKWHNCRKPIIDLLKNCPTEKFIRFEDFDKYAKIFCGNFFRKLLWCAAMIKGYSRPDYYGYGKHEPDWDECEAQIIRLILSFLSAVGMVDIAYTENIPRIKYADDDYCVGISGFRITKLGAWILGITDKYEASETAEIQNDEGELLVQPDYSVIISGLKPRIEHESYLSKFLTKISQDDNAAVYRLDFQSAIRAFDIGITPQKIKAYLKKAGSKPLPENVERSLDDWQTKIGRVYGLNAAVI